MVGFRYQLQAKKLSNSSYEMRDIIQLTRNAVLEKDKMHRVQIYSLKLGNETTAVLACFAEAKGDIVTRQLKLSQASGSFATDCGRQESQLNAITLRNRRTEECLWDFLIGLLWAIRILVFQFQLQRFTREKICIKFVNQWCKMIYRQSRQIFGNLEEHADLSVMHCESFKRCETFRFREQDVLILSWSEQATWGGDGDASTKVVTSVEEQNAGASICMSCVWIEVLERHHTW